jgi:hypothetical protein
VTQPPEVTAEYLRNWVRHLPGSALYVHLVDELAADRDLLRVLNRIEHRPPPNLLFAAVQYLLMAGAGPELARFYPSVVEDPDPPDRAGPVFKAFVLEHEEQIVDMGNSRYTQTNECRRCVALLPMAMLAPFSRFHLVDIGTSAGLNLAMDRYHYRWDALEWGPSSSVILEAGTRGSPPTLHEFEVLSRTGLDLLPIDASDVEARRWLDALILPELAERRQRLRLALELISRLDIELVEGDVLDTLPSVLDSLPGDEPAIVMNSFALPQLSPEGREEVERIAAAARAGREIFRISMEVINVADDAPRLVVDDGSGPIQVGQAHPHGEWTDLFESYARP